MVQERRGEYPSLWAAIESIAPKIGCVPQTLNEWVVQLGQQVKQQCPAVPCSYSTDNQPTSRWTPRSTTSPRSRRWLD